MVSSDGVKSSSVSVSDRPLAWWRKINPLGDLVKLAKSNQAIL